MLQIDHCISRNPEIKQCPQNFYNNWISNHRGLKKRFMCASHESRNRQWRLVGCYPQQTIIVLVSKAVDPTTPSPVIGKEEGASMPKVRSDKDHFKFHEFRLSYRAITGPKVVRNMVRCPTSLLLLQKKTRTDIGVQVQSTSPTYYTDWGMVIVIPQ